MTTLRTKLEDRSLPYYTPAQDSFNSISHLFGAGLSLIGLAACIHLSISEGSMLSLAASIIYCLSNFLLYSMSGIYHGLKAGMTKKVFQVLDHCTIYLMIAGTYTPIILCGIMPVNPTAAWILMAVEWGMAVLNIILNAIDLKKFKVFAFISYLVMGWAIVPMYAQVMNILTVPGFMYILSGGVVYTVGAALYAAGSKYSWMHCVFHVCVLIGSILHFFGIFLYVL